MVYIKQKMTDVPHPQQRKKLNMVLDLDRTLLHSLSTDELTQEDAPKIAHNFDFTDMNGMYIVVHRPGLQEFLDMAFDNYNVSVWTSSTKPYAAFIIENILLSKKNRRIDNFFFSYHSGQSKKRRNTQKKLEMLWNEFGLSPDFSPKNTFIIDDLTEVYDAQPSNTIIAPEFNIDATDEDAMQAAIVDDFLYSLIPLLLDKARKGSSAQSIVSSSR